MAHLSEEVLVIKISTLLPDGTEMTAIMDDGNITALKEIGIKYTNPAPKTTPIPWFNKHSDTHKKQTALQENESTNYVIGIMSENIDYDALPTI